MSSHRIKGRKFSMKQGHRTAMFRNLAVSLLEHEQITTTLPKAKDLKSIVERLITTGKKGGLHARRELLSHLMNNIEVADKTLKVLAERYKTRKGGYTRIIKAGFRHGDNAPLAIIELVDRDLSAKGKNDIARVEAEKKAVAQATAA